MRPQPGMPARRFALHAGALIALRTLAYAALSQHALAADLCQWDCNWYLSIVRGGYDPALHPVGARMQANWAFFPAYPMLVRLVAMARIPAAPAGVLVSSLCLWVFAVFGRSYLSETRLRTSDRTWLALLLAWPYGFLFSAPYSESLYAALVAGSLLALARDRPLRAAGWSALLTATRPTGILLAAWIAARQIGRRRASRHDLLPGLLPVLVAPLGLVAFMLFLRLRTGDALAFVHVQAGWGHALRNPAGVLLDGLRHGHTGLLYDAGWAALGLAASLYLAMTRHWAEAWLLGATVAVALLSGVLWSMPRFVACSPPFLFAVTDLLGSARLHRARFVLLAGAAAMQYLLLAEWYRGAAFLM